METEFAKGWRKTIRERGVQELLDGIELDNLLSRLEKAEGFVDQTKIKYNIVECILNYVG